MSNMMLFYKNVSGLKPDDHKGLKLKPVEGFGFAAGTHWLPVAGVEFYQASRFYPIMFVGEGEGAQESITPILLVGLESGSNDYIGADLRWRADTYIPAFVRRYPFVLASVDKVTAANEFMVCFDADFAGFNTKEGTALFNEDGSQSDLLKSAVAFLNGFKNDMDRTQDFVAELRKLDLLEKRSAEVRSPGGASFQVQDFFVVNEEKFARLTGDQLAALHGKGFLGWIFAHLMSLSNLPALLELHLAKKAKAGKISADKPARA